jgi:hypothetical protein
VPNPDDERFEIYLKQFRPLLPDRLPGNEINPASDRHFGLTIWVLGGVMAIVFLGVVSLRILNHRATLNSNQSAVKLLPPTPPLTVRSANALLAASPSYRAVMNELAFPIKSSPAAKDKQSALAVLGKEKIKL